MATIVELPRLSDTMEEGVVAEWRIAVGDKVKRGQVIADIETDKATMELDSYFDGVLLHIAVKEGQVPINGVIAVIGEEGEDWKAAIAAAGDGGDESEASEEAPAKEEEKEDQEPMRSSLLDEEEFSEGSEVNDSAYLKMAFGS